MPERLGDLVVGTWRGRVSLELADDAQMTAMAADLDGLPDDVVDDWRVVALTVRGRPGVSDTSLRLIGVSRRAGGLVVTSDVVALDLDRGLLVRTATGGLYGLGDPGVGEPPDAHVRHLRSAIIGWGLGRMVGATA